MSAWPRTLYFAVKWKELRVIKCFLLWQIFLIQIIMMFSYEVDLTSMVRGVSILKFYYYMYIGMSAHSVTVNRLDLGAIPTQGDEIFIIYKFIFPFLRSGIEVKHGVEVCHSTRNTSRLRQNVGNGVS